MLSYFSEQVDKEFLHFVSLIKDIFVRGEKAGILVLVSASVFSGFCHVLLYT